MVKFIESFKLRGSRLLTISNHITNGGCPENLGAISTLVVLDVWGRKRMLVGGKRRGGGNKGKGKKAYLHTFSVMILTGLASAKLKPKRAEAWFVCVCYMKVDDSKAAEDELPVCAKWWHRQDRSHLVSNRTKTSSAYSSEHTSELWIDKRKLKGRNRNIA